MSLYKSLITTCLLSLVLVESGNHTKVSESSTRILSRKKRFLVFPEGSSFQVVFCTTYPMLIPIGDIFLFGNTAALAYELPQDPYSPFNHRADPLHRRMDSKTIYYTDYDGKIIHKEPYKRKPIVNPAFAKRSVDSQFEKESSEEFKIDRKQMHGSHKREYLKSKHMDEKSVEFHRSSRMDLYRRVETLLKGFGTNGKHCLLRTLCEVAQTTHQPQGSFLQELMRAVFTLPQGTTEKEHEEYDSAISVTTPCKDVYPECENRLMSLSSPLINY